MTKRTAKEIWDALDEATLDAEMESVLAMTPEERERELEEAGFDLEKVRAQSDAFFEKLQAMPTAAAEPAIARAAEPTLAPAAESVAAPAAESVPAPVPAPPNVVPLTRRTRWLRPAAVIGAGLAFAASVGLVVQLASPPPIVSAPRLPTSEERALAIRRDATSECQREHWKACLDGLDEARALDPKGDEAPEVRDLRKMAGERVGRP
jgi:hypothetical protein